MEYEDDDLPFLSKITGFRSSSTVPSSDPNNGTPVESNEDDQFPDKQPDKTRSATTPTPTTTTTPRTSDHGLNQSSSAPKDEWMINSNDEDMEFFEKGRDYQPRKQKHHFTEEEKEIMATYESVSLKPAHTAVYRHWLATFPPRSDTESWLVIVLIAIIIGILTFAMKVICERLQIFYNPLMPNNYVERGNIWRLWIYYSGLSCTFGALAAVAIIYGCPAAAGSGVPEIIAVLNGVVVRNVLNTKTLVCKIISCTFTVLSSLPVGYEGPLIHIGAMVGAYMSRPSRCQLCRENIYVEKPPETKQQRPGWWRKLMNKVCRYRDSQERHNLICVGAAAGVAAAFSSPVTGLCFAMEEMSTFWTTSLTWQTFVCCILARSTTELCHSIVSTIERGLHNPSELTSFQLSESALFDMKVPLKLSLVVFIPTAFIGILGGMLGALYIFLHFKIARFRRRILVRLHRPELSNAFKIVEVVLLCFICSTLIMLSLPLFHCNRVNHTEPVANSPEVRHLVLRSMDCPRLLVSTVDESVARHEGEFHEGATLIFGSWEQMIRNVLSRKTNDFFGATSLILMFTFLFIFSTWASLVSIASGLLIPQLALGALFGRLVGKGLHELFKPYMSLGEDTKQSAWDFTDPGGLAVLGAAAFFVGVSRQPISAVVMIAELCNDINMSMLVMVAVLLSKVVGDRFTHSLYHSALEFKCIPYLEPELKVYHNDIRVDLELFPVSLVMAQPVKCVMLRSPIYILANLLLETNHGAFPVEKDVDEKLRKRVFVGLISRMELTILLTKTEGFDVNELSHDDLDRIRITYPEYNSTKLKDIGVTNRILQIYSSDTRYKKIYVNLYPYVNLSSHTVTTTFSLQRSYIIFRDLGLRHLVVVDDLNQVQGIVTRRDLLGFVVEEKVKEEIRRIKERHHRQRTKGNSKPHLKTGVKVLPGFKLTTREKSTEDSPHPEENAN